MFLPFADDDPRGGDVEGADAGKGFRDSGSGDFGAVEGVREKASGIRHWAFGERRAGFVSASQTGMQEGRSSGRIVRAGVWQRV